MSNFIFNDLTSLYADAARSRAASFQKSFSGMKDKKKAPVKWPDELKEESREIRQEKPAVHEKNAAYKKAAESEAVKEPEISPAKSSIRQTSSRKKTSEESGFMTQKELEKAVVMSVILGPPACRKRNRYESITGRR